MYKLTLNQYIAANITNQFSQDVDEFILSELSESATSLNTILLEGRKREHRDFNSTYGKGGKREQEAISRVSRKTYRCRLTV